MRGVAVFAIAGLLAAAPAAQQSPPGRGTPQFRTGVEVVEVDVSVLDARRQPVRGLTAADFTILENGRPQDLVSFTAIDVSPPQPVRTGWIRDVAPDVRSNLASADRLVVLVLDDAQVRFAPQHTRAVKDMARRVIERLGPDDLVSVVFTRDNRGAQPFTDDRQRLLTAVETFHGGYDTAAGFAQSYFYLGSLLTLRYVAESLYDAAQRRKLVIYLSPGVPLEGSDSDAFRRRQETQRLVEEARRANVTIYGLDPSGLGGLDGEGGGPIGSVQRQANDFLLTIAERTGGRALVNRNDLVAGVDEVFGENASYYLLGYRSNNADAGSKFRTIEVRANRPGVTVRARSGYVPARAARPSSGDRDTSEALVKAMRDAAPKGDIAMQMTAVPFAVPGQKNVNVAIAIALRQPRLDLGGTSVDFVSLLVGAYGPDGKRGPSERLRSRVVVRPTGDPFVRYELLTVLTLPPGRYQLRVAAESTMHAKEGSLHYDLDVPDYSKGDLQMSGAVVGVEPNVAVAGVNRVSAAFPVVPTSRREFWSGDEVLVFARIYRQLKADDPVTTTTRVRDANDRIVFERTDTGVANLLGKSRILDYRVGIPIDRLPPGPYLVTVEAKTSRETMHRDIRFMRR
jgi:VWFA-related protein